MQTENNASAHACQDRPPAVWVITPFRDALKGDRKGFVDMGGKTSREFAYPFQGHVTRPWRLSAWRRLRHEIRSRMHLATWSLDDTITLEKLSPGPFRPLDREDIPLVFLTWNDRRLMTSFFRHYRSIGVTRFICVDDRSTDGTREFLLEQPDVDLYGSNVRYKEANRGKIWRERLLNQYGHDRWYLNVDSDEYFICDGIESMGLGEIVRQLADAGIMRMPAVMLDLYPVGPLEQAVFEGEDDRMPWEVATHLDGDGYNAAVFRSCLSIQGGARARLFGLLPQLIKYPVVFWSRGCSIHTIHCPLPEKHNFAPVMGGLLHFNIFSDVRERFAAVVANNQHFEGSRYYRTPLERLQCKAGMRFAYDGSIPYLGPADLVAKGFLLPLPRRRRAG